jgi:hypothetical protein
MMPLLSVESRNAGNAWQILDQSLTHYSEKGLRTLVCRVSPSSSLVYPHFVTAHGSTTLARAPRSGFDACTFRSNTTTLVLMFGGFVLLFSLGARAA